MPTVLMFVRIGSRHFAHLYTSGLLALRLGLLGRSFEFPLERGRDDRTIGASSEDVAATVTLPDAARLAVDRHGQAPRARMFAAKAFFDLLHAAADSPTVAGPEAADDSCLSRATRHGAPHGFSKGRMSRPTRWAVSMIRLISS